MLVWEVGLFQTHILILQYGKCSHVMQIKLALNGTNEGHRNETAFDSFKGLFSAPAGFFSFILWRRSVLKAQLALTTKTHFTERCLVVVKYMVFSVKPHYSALVVSCRLPSLKERWPPTSSLQVVSSSERTAWASCAPHSWASQKAILSVSRIYSKTIWITGTNRVNISQRQRD